MPEILRARLKKWDGSCDERFWGRLNLDYLCLSSVNTPFHLNTPGTRIVSMSTNTLIIIIVVVLLLGGGGFYFGR